MRSLIRAILGQARLEKLKNSIPYLAARTAARKASAEAAWRSSFYKLFINAGDLCFDVGANVGNRTYPLLQLGARIIAVEPQANCCLELRRKFGKKITIINKGLGEQQGLQKFYPSTDSTLSTFSADWMNAVKDDRFKDYQWADPVEFEITTIDALIQQYGVPQFIKIDVEGYELQVLKGLSQPVGMISFEYTVPERTQDVLDCIIQIDLHSKDTLWNYSIGESMEWALDQWLTTDEIKTHVVSLQFNQTEFGDIYAKNKTK